jgi:hypothetical protein
MSERTVAPTPPGQSLTGRSKYSEQAPPQDTTSTATPKSFSYGGYLAAMSELSGGRLHPGKTVRPARLGTFLPTCRRSSDASVDIICPLDCFRALQCFCNASQAAASKFVFSRWQPHLGQGNVKGLAWIQTNLQR